jgi:hypothetical protein
MRDWCVYLFEKESDVEIEFHCEAEDEDHAIEQAENAYPGCHIDQVILDEPDFDEDDFDGQPDEMQEWHDFDPDC